MIDAIVSPIVDLGVFFIEAIAAAAQYAVADVFLKM